MKANSREYYSSAVYRSFESIQKDQWVGEADIPKHYRYIGHVSVRAKRAGPREALGQCIRTIRRASDLPRAPTPPPPPSVAGEGASPEASQNDTFWLLFSSKSRMSTTSCRESELELTEKISRKRRTSKHKNMNIVHVVL